jgi:hypothetical protein
MCPWLYSPTFVLHAVALQFILGGICSQYLYPLLIIPQTSSKLNLLWIINQAEYKELII